MRDKIRLTLAVTHDCLFEICGLGLVPWRWKCVCGFRAKEDECQGARCVGRYGRDIETSAWGVVNIEPHDVKKRDVRLGDVQNGLMQESSMKV